MQCPVRAPPHCTPAASRNFARILPRMMAESLTQSRQVAKTQRVFSLLASLGLCAFALKGPFLSGSIRGAILFGVNSFWLRLCRAVSIRGSIPGLWQRRSPGLPQGSLPISLFTIQNSTFLTPSNQGQPRINQAQSRQNEVKNKNAKDRCDAPFGLISTRSGLTCFPGLRTFCQ
jgi:hypothetical protein